MTTRLFSVLFTLTACTNKAADGAAQFAQPNRAEPYAAEIRRTYPDNGNWDEPFEPTPFKPTPELFVEPTTVWEVGTIIIGPHAKDSDCRRVMGLHVALDEVMRTTTTSTQIGAKVPWIHLIARAYRVEYGRLVEDRPGYQSFSLNDWRLVAYHTWRANLGADIVSCYEGLFEAQSIGVTFTCPAGYRADECTQEIKEQIDRALGVQIYPDLLNPEAAAEHVRRIGMLTERSDQSEREWRVYSEAVYNHLNEMNLRGAVVTVAGLDYADRFMPVITDRSIPQTEMWVLVCAHAPNNELTKERRQASYTRWVKRAIEAKDSVGEVWWKTETFESDVDDYCRRTDPDADRDIPATPGPIWPNPVP